MREVAVTAEQGISFLELLLNEELCEGNIIVSTELVQSVGGILKRLKAKRK